MNNPTLLTYNYLRNHTFFYQSIIARTIAVTDICGGKIEPIRYELSEYLKQIIDDIMVVTNYRKSFIGDLAKDATYSVHWDMIADAFMVTAVQVLANRCLNNEPSTKTNKGFGHPRW